MLMGKNMFSMSKISKFFDQRLIPLYPSLSSLSMKKELKKYERRGRSRSLTRAQLRATSISMKKLIIWSLSQVLGCRVWKSKGFIGISNLVKKTACLSHQWYLLTSSNSVVGDRVGGRPTQGWRPSNSGLETLQLLVPGSLEDLQLFFL